MNFQNFIWTELAPSPPFAFFQNYFINEIIYLFPHFIDKKNFSVFPKRNLF